MSSVSGRTYSIVKYAKNTIQQTRWCLCPGSRKTGGSAGADVDNGRVGMVVAGSWPPLLWRAETVRGTVQHSLQKYTEVYIRGGGAKGIHCIASLHVQCIYVQYPSFSLVIVYVYRQHYCVLCVTLVCLHIDMGRYRTNQLTIFGL